MTDREEQRASEARERPRDWPEGLPWDGTVSDHEPREELTGRPWSDDQVEDDDDGPEPQLRRAQRWPLYGGVVALWLLAMALLRVHWWDFDRHGPWLTPVTPFVFAGALEAALIARRPELDRHHDPDGPLGRRRRAHELGDAARPYWAREGAGPEVDGPPPEGS